MRFALLLFLAAADATGGDGIPLATSTAGDGLIVDRVYLNGTGPFRMLVDTGNATSIVRPEVAWRLGLKPRYLVEQDSVAGTRRAPAAILDEVRAGGATDRGWKRSSGMYASAGWTACWAKAGWFATIICWITATAV